MHSSRDIFYVIYVISIRECKQMILRSWK